MTNSKAKRRAEQLGLSYGGACGRLRKSLIFQFAVELGKDKCHVCKQSIESIDEFSIEHIVPWENKPDAKELFFDLSNIAFSHVSCNRPHAYADTRKYSPEGMAWCGTHQAHLPVDQFSPHSGRWNGYKPKCKKCHAAAEKKRRNMGD